MVQLREFSPWALEMRLGFSTLEHRQLLTSTNIGAVEPTRMVAKPVPVTASIQRERSMPVETSTDGLGPEVGASGATQWAPSGREAPYARMSSGGR